MDGNIMTAYLLNPVFWAVVVIFLVFAAIGHKKGLIKMVISFASVFVTTALVMVLQPIISDSLVQTKFYNNLYETAAGFVSEELHKAVSETDTQKFVTNAQNEALQIINRMGGFLPKNISETIVKKIDQNPYEETVGQLVDRIADRFANIIMELGIFIVSFLIILILVKLVFAALNLISFLPVIHGVNKLAGMILGAAEGLCVVWIFFMVLTVFGGSALDSNLYVEIFKDIHCNQFLELLYNKNIIMNLLLK